ncbi:hypothetical protein [Nannocystis bainbridge]|uniref:Lipoprotein n=1 Tax=Nannocystis bainbridge TaxID=2995303 RepID=A0ABT5DZA3_9BACT|nr:hypothetical protein [Nannocystis bainbridge]MDC0718943.1 hypothetical protein [Nannocystis bainbridge]
MRRPLIAALILAACGPTAPAPTEVAKSAPAEAAKAPTPSPAPTPEAAPAPAEKLTIAKEPPLTPEEIALIEADTKNFTPEQHRARAHALRRKILQNPDSPQAQQLEQLRRDVEAGTVKPELPPKSGDAPGKGLTLHAPAASSPPAPATPPAP